KCSVALGDRQPAESIQGPQGRTRPLAPPPVAEANHRPKTCTSGVTVECLGLALRCLRDEALRHPVPAASATIGSDLSYGSAFFLPTRQQSEGDLVAGCGPD